MITPLWMQILAEVERKWENPRFLLLVPGVLRLAGILTIKYTRIILQRGVVKASSFSQIRLQRDRK